MLLLGGAALFEIARGRRERLRETPWRVASWTAPALAAPLIAYTAFVLVADAVRTPTWTLTRQNVETLQGDLRCGLADDTVVATTSTMRPLARLGDGAVTADIPPWAPSPPLAGGQRFFLGLVDGRPSAGTPWFEAPEGENVGVFIAGMPGSPAVLDVEWGRREDGRTERIGGGAVEGLSIPEEIGLTPWRFFPSRELSPRPAGANALRFTLRSATPVPATVVVTAPVAYANERLVDRLETTGTRTLVPPHLLTYVPCADLPELRDGIVEVPDQIVWTASELLPDLQPRSDAVQRRPRRLPPPEAAADRLRDSPGGHRAL